MARGLLLKAGLAVALTAIGAGLIAGLPGVSDALAVDIGQALAAPGPDGTQMFQGCGSWHNGPDCWTASALGRGLALFAILLTGIPVSIMGISLATGARRGAIARSDVWRSVYYGASVFQGGTAAIAALVLVLMAWETLSLGFVEPDPTPFLFLLANVLCGTLAMPAWRQLACPVQNSSRDRYS
jgi:hypothetical protein